MALIGYWSLDKTLVENSGNRLDLQLFFGSAAYTTAYRNNGFDFDTTNGIRVINASALLVQPQMSIALWMKPDLTSIDNAINSMIVHKFDDSTTVFGDAPFAVKRPPVIVTTPSSRRLPAPVPSNVIILHASPSPPLDASANLPVTVTSLPHGTFLIVFSVRTVWIDSLGGGGAFTITVNDAVPVLPAASVALHSTVI
jgi:hypothetical protein